MKSMMSNKQFSIWAKIMSNDAAATAMLIRLLHYSHVISLKGDTYRMKDRLNTGMVNFE